MSWEAGATASAAVIAAVGSLSSWRRSARVHKTARETQVVVAETQAVAVEAKDSANAAAEQLQSSNGTTVAETVEATAGTVEGLATALVRHASDGHGGDSYPPRDNPRRL